MKPPRPPRQGTSWLALFTLFITACALGFHNPAGPELLPQSKQRQRAPTTATAVGSSSAMADSVRIPVAGSPSQGAADALVTIVEFSDLQCPFCARVEDSLSQVQQKYGTDVRIVWKNNPLPFHDRAMDAAEAAMAAYAQGKFWEFKALVFQNQRALSRTDLEGYAQQLGLDMNRFRGDLDQHAWRSAVEADMRLATQLNAAGTPFFFINGTEFVGAQPAERFNEVIDLVLARARTITPRTSVYATMVGAPVAMPTRVQPTAPARRQLDPAAVYRVPVGNSPSLGPADALVTVVEFGDYQCPFCGRVEGTLSALRARYGNDVRVVWKNHPLEFHANAKPAAEAAMEAYAQGGNEQFWRFHAMLYQHQGDPDALGRQALENYAQQLSLDLTRFRNALDQHTHLAEIEADAQLSVSLEAAGTPCFFVNGKRLVGARPLEDFINAVDAAKTAATEAIQHGATRTNVYATLTDHAQTSAVYLAADGSGEAANGERAAARQYTVRPNPSAPRLGPANASVVIQHFSDFQCPFCARILPTLAQVRANYGARVAIVWRDYPLPFHQNAMLAAEAAREVLAQKGNDAFWAYHDVLFQNQRDLTRENLESWAQAQGVDLTRFRAALDNHTHQAAIRADMAAADATGAEMGTPASFVNGRFVSGAVPYTEFQSTIDALPTTAPTHGPARRPPPRHR